jgi:glycosyltransferase involved in cell wall biosynthesis
VRKLGLEDRVTVEAPVPHDRVPAAIAAAAVCVAPLGYNERNVAQGCCPIKVLEYMACGRPIVAANLPVVRELVRPDRDALLFTPDDPADLARGLLAVLDDPALAARLGGSAAAHVRVHFTWQAAQQRLLEVYRELLEVT